MRGTRSSERGTPWALALGACLLHAGLARAEPAGPAVPAASAAPCAEEPRARARAELERGLAAYRAERFGAALDAFLEGYRICPRPTFLFNAARAHDRLGHVGPALSHYRAYLRAAPDAADRGAVAERIAALETALAAQGVQQVTVLSEPPGATVTVDDRAVGTTPWTGELVPGAHRLRVEQAGRAPQERSLELAPDRSLEVTVALEPALPPPAPAAEPAPTPPPVESPVVTAGSELDERDEASRPGLRPLTWVALGGAALALGGAAVVEARRQATAEDVRTAPVQLDRYDALDRYDDQTRAVRLVAGVGVGLGVVGATLVTFDLTRHRARSVGLRCGPTGCTLSAQGEL